MSLIDTLLDQGMDAENDPHPQEGVFFADEGSSTGTFLRVEEEIKMREQDVPEIDEDENIVMGPNGQPVMTRKMMPFETGRHQLVKYDAVERDDAKRLNLPEGKVITLDTWDGCVYWYEKQVKVLKGDMTQDDFDKEMEERTQTGMEPEVAAPAEEDKYPEMLVQCMSTITQPRGLDDDRLSDYLKYELEQQFGIDSPDDQKIDAFIYEFRKADQPEIYDPDYVAPSGTGFYAEEVNGRVIVAFPSEDSDAANAAMSAVGGQTVAECVFQVPGDLQSVSDQMTDLGHTADNNDAKELLGFLKEGGFLDAPPED
jgi:hypothetical protein